MNHRKNHIGRNSLIISIVGLIVVQLLIYFGYLKNDHWHILLSGFEAATIGGFADWFAVSALFHEIPIPLVRKHTNIIVRNRKKLTEGIVDLVTNKWLSPDIIKEKISNIQIIENIIKTVKEPQNSIRLFGFIKDITSRIISNIDNPEVVKMFQSILKDQVKGIDFATPLGKWLKNSIDRGDHEKLWDMILDSAERAINDTATRDSLLNTFKYQLKDYKDEGFFKGLFIKIAEGIGAIDDQSIVDKLLNSMNEFVKGAKGNPNHSIRLRFDESILDFAENLIAGDEKSTKIISDLQDRLVDNADAKNIIQGILTNFKISIINELSNNDTPLINFLKQNVDNLLSELETDKSSQEKIDRWIKETIEQLVSKYHHEIGEMVRMSLSKLDDFELVNQIEEKVGNDLQFIRLNGAVIGGFVGLVISLTRLIFL